MTDSDKQALIDGSATIETQIEIHDRNLFDNSDYDLINGILADGGTLVENEYYETIYIPCEQETTYIISKKASQYFRVAEFSDIPEIGDSYINRIKQDDYSTQATFTTTTGNYLAVNYTPDKGVRDSIRIEKDDIVILTENNSVVDWNHEDFRQVKDEGFIGQFVARQLTGTFRNLGDNFKITDKELLIKLGVKINDNTNWYSLGNFLVTKVTDDEVGDKTKYEALDYTKLFNKPYINRLDYPCTAQDLAEDVCSQCGVELGNNDFKNNDYVISGNPFTNNESCRDVMKAIGKLAFSWVRVDWDNKVYIDFDSSSFTNLHGGYEYSKSTNGITYQYNIDGSITANGTATGTAYSMTSGEASSNGFLRKLKAGTYTLATGLQNVFVNVVNSNGTVIANTTSTTYTRQFTLSEDTNVFVRLQINSGTTVSDETIYVTLKKEPSEYDTIANNKYYNLKTQKEVYGPVDKVVIGYSAIEGERTYIGDHNGKCVITVYDNPLVFNQEQRASIINSANDLLGMTYTPLNTQTVGHPWLKGNELVRVSDMEGVSHDTMPLDRTIQYFGHIKTVIDSTTPTKTNNNLSYKAEMVKNYEKSEIYNDQINKEIGAIIEQQTNTTNRLNQTVSTLDGTIQRVSRTETSITDITTTTQTSIGKNSLYLEDATQSNALSYQVDGATEQDSYSGKNLLQTKFPFNTTYNGVTCTTDADGTITLNGTPTTRTDFTVISALMTLPANTKYSLNYIYVSGSMNGYLGIYNEDGNHSWQGWDLEIPRVESTNNKSISHTYTYDWNSSLSIVRTFQDTTYNNLKFKIQLVSNSDSDYEYEPYVGGTVSPNPDYPQEVRNIPSIINLYNPKHTKSDGTYYVHSGTIVEQDGQFTITATGSDMFLWIHKESNMSYDEAAGELYKLDSDSYIVSIDNPLFTKNYVTYYDENKISLGFKSKPSSTFTINKSEYPNAKYFSIRIGYGSATSGTSYSFKIQLEEGSIAHEYVPYGAYARVKVTGKNVCNGINKNVWISGSYDVVGIGTSNSGLYIPVNSEKYTISTTKTQTRYRAACTDIEPNSNSNIPAYNGGLYDNTNRTITIDTTGHKYLVVDATDLTAIQIESGETSTSYEPYKEREVLIDLSKENLFTNDEERYWNKSANIYKTDNGVRIIQPDSGQYRFAGYILDANPMLGKTFTISCDYKSSNTNNVPLVNVYWFNKSTNNITTQIKALSTNGGTFSVPSTATNDNIAILFYSNLNGSSSAANDYTDYTNIKLFEGESKTPYYELCKIGAYKDTLSIDASGNCVINKNIYKIDMNSGTLTNHGYVSGNSDANYSQFNIVLNTSRKPTPVVNDGSQWGSTFKSKYFSYYSGAANPNKTQSGMRIWDNYPDIVLSFPTPLLTTGQESQSFINWANNNDLSIYGVLRTPETITLPNAKIPLFDGINHVTLVDDLETSTSITYYRKTPLSGTYATVTQLNDVSTEKTTEIQTVRQEMLLNISNEAVRINAINETIDETGVPIVKTDTGYTFDIDGMKIEKSENDVSTIVDNDGLAVSYKNTEILTARSSGVEAENITTRKFYVQRPIRMEKTKSISDGSSVGLGFYYIGE